MQRPFLLLSSFSGAVAVLLGAFGAHYLKEKLSTDALHSFQTGVSYQFWHTFALITVAILIEKYQGRLLTASGYLFAAGIILFSGSLYLLSTRALWGGDAFTWIGAITPVGGLCFAVAWILMLINFTKN